MCVFIYIYVYMIIWLLSNFLNMIQVQFWAHVICVQAERCNAKLKAGYE